MDDFNLHSPTLEVKSKQNQHLIKANVEKFQFGDRIDFTYHTAGILISPPLSMGVSSAALLKKRNRTPESCV